MMKMSKCLFCYKELNYGEVDFHKNCLKKFFGEKQMPIFQYNRSDMDRLAREIIVAQTTITGVQPKLSLHLQEHEGTKRLTIVGLKGNFIFKPQTEHYKNLPENEDLTMHLAEIARIQVVPHSLIRLSDGELGYISKRIDRMSNNTKLAMEDMCQLTNRPTEHKYRSSYEQIAKTILRYSTAPMLDLVNFYDIVLFSWLTGNADMHLKNFSMYSTDDKEFRLAPAYDLINTAIANPSDKEELALTLNGKKNRIGKGDLYDTAMRIGINEKTFSKLLDKYINIFPKWTSYIENSFLNDCQKLEYKNIIKNKLENITK